METTTCQWCKTEGVHVDAIRCPSCGRKMRGMSGMAAGLILLVALVVVVFVAVLL